MNDETLLKIHLPINKQKKALKKLNRGYPVQYLLKNVDFAGIPIIVNKNVLIPRFETEFLVDKLKNLIENYNFINPNILDIGTGSGCIGIFLKKNINCDVTAIDNSKKAISVAKKNTHNNYTNITFINKKIEKFFSLKKFDVIVSNPPYIAFTESVDEKTKYEPQKALFAKDNGLYFYNVILDKSHELIKARSIIAFEIGFKQGPAIVNLAKSHYPKAKIILEKDLNDFDRYVFIINE